MIKNVVFISKRLTADDICVLHHIQALSSIVAICGGGGGVELVYS